MRFSNKLTQTLLKKIDIILKNWRFCQWMGFPVAEDTTLYTLHFADGQVILAQKDKILEEKIYDKLINK